MLRNRQNTPHSFWCSCRCLCCNILWASYCISVARQIEVVLYWNFLSEAQLLRTAMSFIMRTAVLLFSLGKYWQWVFLQMNSMGEGNVLLNNQKKNGIYELLKLLRSISICFGLNSSELHFFAVCFRLDLPLRFSDCGSPAWKKCHTAVLQLFQFSYSHNLV